MLLTAPLLVRQVYEALRCWCMRTTSLWGLKLRPHTLVHQASVGYSRCRLAYSRLLLAYCIGLFWHSRGAFQLVGTRIEGVRFVLWRRVNVNTKVITLEDVCARKKLELVGKAAMLVRETGTPALNLLVYEPGWLITLLSKLHLSSITFCKWPAIE